MTPKMGAATRMKMEVPGLSEATAQIGSLNTALTDLKGALTTLNTTSFALSQGITKLMGNITSGATQATKAVQGLTGSVGGTSGSGSTTGSTATQAIAAASGGGGSGGGWNIAQSMFSGVTSDFAKDVAMFPLRFMTSQINTNRQLGLTAATALSPQGFASNLTPGTMMNSLARLPGSVLGSPTDLLSLMGISRQAGGFTDLSPSAGNAGRPSDAQAYTQMNAPRAAGLLRGVREAQMMNPGQSVAEITQTIAGFSASAASQKQSMMMSGGAFGMISTGGRQRSVSEWAENILKFLTSQRPGNKRNNPFTRGELLAQYFPGSNIDAWFDANGVPQGMKEYWWTYALGKTAMAGGGLGGSSGGAALDFSVGGGVEKNPVFQENQAYQRLKSTTSATRGQFGLASTLSGTYANKEVANTWFNDMMGQLLQQIIPQALSSTMSFMQYLPDDIQDMLMTALNRTGMVGALAGGALGYGGAADNLSDVFGSFLGGDVGDWGTNGATSTAGLHPDMRQRVDSMMAANPRIKVNSGLRDMATQKKLKARGGNRVSGKASAHTRGMAADLGPASEYPWIVANARKFGLASGNSQGEPWHVGMGDVGDINLPSLSNIWEALTGEGAGQASSIAGIVGSIMQLVTGVFGSRGGIDQSKLAFLGTDLYDQMYGAGTYDFSKSGLSPSGSNEDNGTFQRNPSTLPGGGGGGSSGGTLTGFFTQVLTGLGVPASQVNLDKMGAVAKQEGYRAGAYNPWNSNAGPGTNHNSQGIKNYPDEATGIDQTIRLLSQTSRGRPVIIDNLRKEGSFNAFIDATETYYRSWDPPGAPPAQINVNQSQGHNYLTTPLGDMESMMMPDGGSGMKVVYGGPVFHNNFQIQGGGGGGGIDTKRTASMLADQLEEQMRQRAARRN